MFIVIEADATPIRHAFEHGGKLSDAAKSRKRFPAPIM
jgi:hypothetical protein